VIGEIAISSFGLFLSFLWVYLSAADTPSGGATDVLQESYTLSAALTNEDRVFFLVRLTDISTDIAPGLTESWCSELQNRARTLPQDWNRVASEKMRSSP
jgi:hypothetical protein